MSDVVVHAKAYRERLLKDLARVEDFLRMGDALSKLAETEVAPVRQPEQKQAPIPRMQEPAPADDEDERDDAAEPAPALELTEPKEAAPPRRGLFFRNAFEPAGLDRGKISA